MLNRIEEQTARVAEEVLPVPADEPRHGGPPARNPKKLPQKRAAPPKTTGELRKFGLVMAVPLGAIGGYLLWKGRPSGFAFAGLAAFFLLCAGIYPRALGPVERGWMAVAGVLSVVMTYVILTLTYFLVITPMGLLVRATGKDLLQLKLERQKSSYWEPVDPEGPASRSDTPY